jgi:galactoside O-acetyltransferase
MGLLTPHQIGEMGFASVGSDVRISDRCSIYGAGSIRLGDHVRIDDFAVLTAREALVIGSYVHVSAFVFLSGQFGIEIGDFVNVSPRATLLSGNDDFSGEWLPGPFSPPELRGLRGEPIRLGRHCMVGAHSVVLPGASFGEGAVVGSLSLVKGPLAPWSVYAGVPARLIRPRLRTVADRAARLERGP